MPEAKKLLLERFHQDFLTLSILFTLLIAMTVVLLIVYAVKFKRSTTRFRIGMPAFTLLLIAFTFFFGLFVSKYYRDYVYLKANDPIYIEGKVTGFSITVSDDLTVTKSWPIVLVDETNEEIALSVVRSEEKLEIDQEYAFLYLPNTKTAEIVPSK